MGGNQVNFVEKIRHDRIPPTMKLVKDLILEPSGIKDFQVLGSQGKKEFSGDIDVGIDIKNTVSNDVSPKNQIDLKYDKIQDNIQKNLMGNEYSVKELEDMKFIHQMKGLGIISVSCPQITNENKFDGKFVQLDLIFGNLDFMKDYTDTLFFEEDLEKIGIKNEDIGITNYKNVYKNGVIIQQLDTFTKKVNQDGTITKILISYNGLKQVVKKGKKTIEEKYLNYSFLDFFKKIFKDETLTKENMVSLENLVKYLKNNPYTNKHYNEIMTKFKVFCKGMNLEIPSII